MLSPGLPDEDDDSHLCIKCNATIVGLDNYVKHRKERCGKKYDGAIKVNKREISSLDTLDPAYSLGADIFFQSLELQSSVKKPSLSRLTPPITVPTKTSQIIDRSKALVVASSSRDMPRMSLLESNMRGEDWIGGHSIRLSNNEADNQTRLIHAVASISGAAKKDIPTSSYSITPYNDFKCGDESDEASEDSEDDEDDEPLPSGGKWKPPSHYTGGKWHPDSPEQEDWDAKEEQEHLGGKWKLLLSHDNPEAEEDYDAPPPGHTKGKWVPGAQEQKTQIMQTTIQTKTSVQYWCGPCNRRLGSRAIYEKHLMSNLHMRKILPENDLEFSGHLEPRNVSEKRASRPSQYTNDSIYQSVKRTKKVNATMPEKPEKRKRNRKPIYTQCSGCKSRVKVHLMGKHLISHYHFRKATDVSSDAYRQLILDNMDAIVHQSPFQCSPCKFYTNWLSSFMQHWFSQDHERTVTSLEGRYWCSFCKFECESSEDMLQHISSSDHNEVVAVVNRSMPIIIRKRTVFKCATCAKECRYNIELKKHSQKTGHELAHTSSDIYQELHKCQYCNTKFKCSLALAAHLKTKHKQKAFMCLVCSKTFATSEEAKKHRQTSEHKVKRKEMLKEKGLPVKDMRKKCPYCVDVILPNILDLKDHIRTVHPEMKKKCPSCGMAFILSQEVTRHVRSNECRVQTPAKVNSSTFWSCSQCLFTTDSQAECFFHEVLHSAPNTEVYKVGNQEKLVKKYHCPLCPKAFRKVSLRHHIRQHTFERPFICLVCGANFTTQTSLNNHSKTEHGLDMRSRSIAKTNKIVGKEIIHPEEFRCNICNSRFSNKSSLTRHISDCNNKGTEPCILPQFRCTHDQCDFVTTTIAKLYRHKKRHGEVVKRHACPHCPFKSVQASHLKRHLVCHRGTKPYACPHCSFVCASLENLRKHALRSGRHRGLPLYRCGQCAEFATDAAAALRSHLTTAHALDAASARRAVAMHLMLTE